MATKICKKCGIEKPLDEFYKDKSKKDGHENKCKECKYTKKKIYVPVKEGHKICCTCGEEKSFDNFYKKGNGYRSNCKECENKRIKKYANTKKRKEYLKEYKRSEKAKESNSRYNKSEKAKQNKLKYKQTEKGKKAEMKYRKSEKGKNAHKVRKQKRRALEKQLPCNLTNEKWLEILNTFNGSCPLTNETENIHLEHFIPLCSGHGGTTVANCYPMTAHLNLSKNGKNPFEWIKTQPNDIQHNFYNKLVPYLADKNAMTIDEFKTYVYWCMENPKKMEE